jgi:hypothetical protein
MRWARCIRGAGAGMGTRALDYDVFVLCLARRTE